MNSVDARGMNSVDARGMNSVDRHGMNSVDRVDRRVMNCVEMNSSRMNSTDAPHSMDQYMESALDADHDDQIISTEVRPSDRTRQTDWQSRLSRPTRQAMTDDRARINFERTDSDSDRSFSFLVRLGRTAFREKLHSDRADCPAHVLVLTAGRAAGYIESGQKFAPNNYLLLVGPVRYIRQQIENRLFVRPENMSSEEERNRPGNFMAGLSNLQMRALNDTMTNLMNAVYRIDPRTSGKELRLDPRPDDRTEARLSRPTRQARTDDRARINFERTDSDSYRSFSFLVRLGHTACTDGRTDGLSDYFDPIFEFNHQEFSKATILKLSDDLSHIWSSSVREKLHSDRTDCLAHVLVLTAGRAAGYI
ncbi:hypothetical protein F2Q70_00004175 [Brassica cretica]|uniref:Uncharacterized protein n=1 Tax=Brassica cretica TaxID=69181 RepID=A0A8S9IPU1_BRACR|nr:hypothetical protein F2Q70_00004175 [Brassica cretica]